MSTSLIINLVPVKNIVRQNIHAMQYIIFFISKKYMLNLETKIVPAVAVKQYPSIDTQIKNIIKTNKSKIYKINKPYIYN